MREHCHRAGDDHPRRCSLQGQALILTCSDRICVPQRMPARAAIRPTLAARQSASRCHWLDVAEAVMREMILKTPVEVRVSNQTISRRKLRTKRRTRVITSSWWTLATVRYHAGGDVKSLRIPGSRWAWKTHAHSVHCAPCHAELRCRFAPRGAGVLCGGGASRSPAARHRKTARQSTRARCVPTSRSPEPLPSRQRRSHRCPRDRALPARSDRHRRLKRQLGCRVPRRTTRVAAGRPSRGCGGLTPVR
jgi:hypothetical protein